MTMAMLIVGRFSALLPRDFPGKLAVANTRREILGIARGRFLAVGRDQLGERKEERSLRQAIAVDAFVSRLYPRLLQITQRRPLLFVIGHGLVCRRRLCRNAH